MPQLRYVSILAPAIFWQLLIDDLSNIAPLPPVALGAARGGRYTRLGPRVAAHILSGKRSGSRLRF